MIFDAEKAIAQAQEQFKGPGHCVTGPGQDEDAAAVGSHAQRKPLASEPRISLMAVPMICGSTTLVA